MILTIAGNPVDHPFDMALVDADMTKPFHSDPAVSAADLCELFLAQGIECYVMGGAVRNWLTGKTARDIDMTVACPIEQALATLAPLAPHVAIKPKPLFGLAYLLGYSGDIDVNSMRTCDHIGDNPDIDSVHFRFHPSLRTDAECRDFTINAFYMRMADRSVFNIFDQALSDLHGKVLRLIMDERKLRIDYRLTIRILQFMARGYTPTDHTLAALKARLDADVIGFDAYREWMLFHVPPGSEDWAAYRELALHHAAAPESRARLERWFAEGA